MRLYHTPSNITGFRKIAKRHRNGKTPEQLLKLHDERQGNQPYVHPVSLVRWIVGRSKINVGAPANVRAIPLGLHNANGIKACEDNRKKNWRSDKASVLHSRIVSHDCGRYSSRVTYTKYEYTRCVESWGAVIGTTLYYRIDTREGVRTAFLKAPRGYRWDIDENGIRIVSLTDERCDYHPTASDLLQGVDLVAWAKGNLAARKENARKAREFARDEKRALGLIRKAEREGATVCLRDSLRAGNCEAGTIAWAQRHGLDTKGHYRPSQLSKIANGDGLRVAMVIATAIRRHRLEMDRGYAELSDHR